MRGGTQGRVSTRRPAPLNQMHWSAPAPAAPSGAGMAPTSMASTRPALRRRRGLQRLKDSTAMKWKLSESSPPRTPPPHLLDRESVGCTDESESGRVPDTVKTVGARHLEPEQRRALAHDLPAHRARGRHETNGRALHRRFELALSAALDCARRLNSRRARV
jgi:hypothetical protein